MRTVDFHAHILTALSLRIHNGDDAAALDVEERFAAINFEQNGETLLCG